MGQKAKKGKTELVATGSNTFGGEELHALVELTSFIKVNNNKIKYNII